MRFIFLSCSIIVNLLRIYKLMFDFAENLVLKTDEIFLSCFIVVKLLRFHELILDCFLKLVIEN
jgi:hypothetical protein